ncbi:MAG TPA: CHASE2 domain-containing protein [Steroidobacteraceae bacterium]|nr:CHASE2 domain-containing protein [Steroidobacteraceae bacterium]
MSEPAKGGDAPSKGRERFEKYREKVLEGLATGAVLGIIAKLNQSIVDQVISQPWQILLVVIPLGAAAWLTWQVAKRPDRRRTHWAFPVFLVIYCTGFALLSTSELLVWERTPNPQPETSRSWLVPSRWGDWRYMIVPRPEAPTDTVIVMVEAPQADNIEQLRFATLEVVQKVAEVQRLRGLALDFYFEQKADLDFVLCDLIPKLKADVFAGYTLEVEADPNSPLQANANPLEACIPFDTREGHLLAWADGDGYVRTVPLHWKGQLDRPAFSVRIAQARAPKLNLTVELPKAKMLRYVAPSEAIPEYDWARVQVRPSLLNDKFVFVGRRSKEDTRQTPFGEHSGTWIQAAAVNSLLTGAYMTRASDLSSALLVFVACYAIVLVASSGASLRSLLVTAAAVSIGVMLLAVGAAYRSVWFDAIYAIVACWLLVPLVFGLSKTLATNPGSASTP